MQMHEGVDRNYVDYSWNLNTTEESYNLIHFQIKFCLRRCCNWNNERYNSC